MRQNWRLKKLDVAIRKTGGVRYRVDAYLSFEAPVDAHPDRFVGPLRVHFAGDYKTQDLSIDVLTINGREPDRRLITPTRLAESSRDRGTTVMGSIEKPLRTQPWSVHLAVSMNAEAGVIGLPRCAVDASSIPVTIKAPNGEVTKHEGLVESIVVDAAAAARASSWVLTGGLALAAVITVAAVVIIRRRRGV